MKKLRLILCFPLLALLAFVYTDRIPAGSTGSISSVITKGGLVLHPDHNYPVPEIEHGNIHGHNILHSYPGSQKIPGHIAGNTRDIVICSLLSSSTAFPAVELFDNNYLSYNYPSHNFW
jgi:hypothetical protein